MKRLSLILLLLFAAWGGLRAQPALTLLQKGYDLGSIPEDGGTVSRVYTFRNSGNAPLVVVRAETSCTCTKADISKKPVMPGQEGTVTVIPAVSTVRSTRRSVSIRMCPVRAMS